MTAIKDPTPRQVDVLRLVADGLTNKEIAVELGISQWTVVEHLNRAFATLGVRTRAQAAVVADRRGLLAVAAHGGESV